MITNFAKPFDTLPTTRAYAQSLADMTGTTRVVVRVHPQSDAAALGMLYGVFTMDEASGEDIVEVLHPTTPARTTPKGGIW